jgi:hypothetical protein
METKKRKKPEFKHKALKGPRLIRLIQVHPSEEFDDPVEISFLHTNLDRPDRYQTLSYTWQQASAAGSTIPQLISCNGHTLHVSSNLHDFLRQLRSKLTSGGRLVNLPIWIDALSINQDDEIEREQQVRMMAEIYKRSFRLVIWLGEVDIPIEIGLSSARARRHKPKERKIITQIVQLPWFRRRWVIQEVLNSSSRTMWIGTREMNFTSFVTVTLAQLAEPLVPPILKNITGDRAADNLKRTLLENLWFWDRTACKVAHDLINFLLSISKDREDFDVTYTGDVKAAFCQVAARIVESQNGDNVSAMLVSAICRSQKPSGSWRAPRSRTTPQSRKPLSKDVKAFKDRVRLSKQELESFKNAKALTRADLKALEMEKAVRTVLPSWVPDWRNTRRRLTPEEQECVDRCFTDDVKSGIRSARKLAVRGSLHEQNQYLILSGWLFPGCQCTLTSSKPHCSGCHTARPPIPENHEGHEGVSTDPRSDGGDPICWCVDCKTSSLEECNILRKNKRLPRIAAEQSLCLLKYSAIAYVLSAHGGDAINGKTVFQLDTCFLVPPFTGNRNAKSQLGKLQEIVLA